MKTIEEKNKLIAEFMGFKLQDNPNERWFGQWFTNPTDVWSNRIEILHFDSSWDWLMPVVSKITRDETLIENEYRESIMDTVPYGLIEDSYKVVVEFIKWYNQQKSN